MTLKFDYKGDASGFALEQHLEANIREDAEALGYITNVLFETAKRLAELLEKANPEYQNRIDLGVAFATKEKEREDNPNYPFTTCLIVDE